MKHVCILLFLAGFLFTGQSVAQAAGGGAVPWDAIAVDTLPLGWTEYNGGDLTVLIDRLDVNSVFSFVEPCPFGTLVMRMTFYLKLKVDRRDVRVYSQVKDIVLCDTDFDGQWEALKAFLNAKVIQDILEHLGLTCVPAQGPSGNWVITKLVKPAGIQGDPLPNGSGAPSYFMTGINFAVNTGCQ